jgi:hypothetical protein
MGVDSLMWKALRLAKEGRVFKESSEVFHVKGDHGTYLVQKDKAGRYVCSCTGFWNRGRCSHSLATSIAESQKTAVKLDHRSPSS